MPNVNILNLNNEPVGSVELADSVFAAEVKQHLLWESVRHHLASLRRGTHKTKTRAEVSGSGKKLWKQKGTGRARVGSIRSPLWRHGGIVHGPQPRDYSYKLNRKMIAGALRSALSAKLRDGELKVVQAFALESHKTKPMRQALDRLEGRRKVLLVDVLADGNGNAANLEKASRNLQGVTLRSNRDVTTYDLLNHQLVVLSEAAARKLSEGLAQ